MTSRQRVRLALDHREPDRVPLDLGATAETAIQPSAYAALRRTLGLPPAQIRVFDPFQMLAEVDRDVQEALEVDVHGIRPPGTLFGFRNEVWKRFRFRDGLDVLVSGHFNTVPAPDGRILQYPQGDTRCSPSAFMPPGGYYFDCITRQKPIEEDRLDARAWVEETFSALTEEDLGLLEREADWYHRNTTLSLFGDGVIAGFGGIIKVQGPHIKNPNGIRDPEEWYISLLTRKDHIHEIFGYQAEIQLRNLARLQEAVGDRIDVIRMSGTDLGGQQGPLVSRELFRELFQPPMRRLNEWVHRNTGWKTYYHSCGSIAELLEDFIDAGVDIVNPVQVSAAGMAPRSLKERFGSRLVFWGGGVDTQRVLPFGSVDDVQRQVRTNVSIFKKGGGYVFCPVHNIQDDVSAANVAGLFGAFRDCRDYGTTRGEADSVQRMEESR